MTSQDKRTATSNRFFCLPLSIYGAGGDPCDTAKTERWEIEYIRPRNNSTGSRVQRGGYKAGTFSLLAELGEIEIPTLPIPFGSLTNKGARLSYLTGYSGTSLRLAAITATNDRHAEPAAGEDRTLREFVLVGMSGEFGF